MRVKAGIYIGEKCLVDELKIFAQSWSFGIAVHPSHQESQRGVFAIQTSDFTDKVSHIWTRSQLFRTPQLHECILIAEMVESETWMISDPRLYMLNGRFRMVIFQ